MEQQSWNGNRNDWQNQSAWSTKDKWADFYEMQEYTILTKNSSAGLVIKLQGNDLAHIASPGSRAGHRLDLGPMRVRVVGSVESLGGAGSRKTWLLEEGKDLMWNTDHWITSLLRVPPNTTVEFCLCNIWQWKEANHAPGLQSAVDRERCHSSRRVIWSGLCRFTTPRKGQVLQVTLPASVAGSLYRGRRSHSSAEVFTEDSHTVQTTISSIEEHIVQGRAGRASWSSLPWQVFPLPAAGRQCSFSFRGGQKCCELMLNVNLYVPPGFDPNEDKDWPLMLFLHSQHCRFDGDLNLHYESDTPPRLVLGDSRCPESLRNNFIILSPQNLSSRERGDIGGDGMWLRRGEFGKDAEYDYPAEAVIWDLIETVKQSLPIDRTRISLVGTSMGGQGALQLASRWPGFFAACVPVAAHFEFEPLDAVALRLVQEALPMWFFHAVNDHICSHSAMQGLARRIRHHSPYNAEVHFTSFYDTWSSGHHADRIPFWKNEMTKDGPGGWRCFGDDLFEWLATQSGPGLTCRSLTPTVVEKWTPPRSHQ
eukprot:CAMPEP_0206470016 /NCGR_PEP_ID=MMETSP0324_2-20121206/30648_1 /ASSEMBLY_ACC=CAM_ASM_000836 /TAXON_ID=2866 /ORGANISM="Crypthecodinium cohnii, Strain Seligo" /LENGTH=536 /DNA_ID=CAMNT_0053943933 /DNA_START=198 /DNA_END=1808 /DNA_ORIENTATION=-